MADLIVVDTNVLVAGLRSRNGASFRLLQLIFANRVKIALSVSLAAEYEDVLYRHQSETAFTMQDMTAFVDAIYYIAEFVEIYYLWRPYLRDAYDDHILELAVAAQSNFIITHNLKDFVGLERFGISAITPNQFIGMMGDEDGCN